MRFTFIVSLFFLLLTSCAHQNSTLPARTVSEETPPRTAWIGPMPYIDGNTVQIEPPYEFVRGALIRRDYRALFTQPSQWNTLIKKTKVFKMYLGVLYKQEYPKYTDFGSTDEQLRNMAQFFKENDIQVAIELGGIRPPFKNCSDLVTATFQEEKKHLERWISLGGRIDFIHFDHPIGFSLMSQTWDRKTGAPLKTNNQCQNSFGFIAQEAARSMKMYQDYFQKTSPNLKVGLIESLGYYTFLSRTPQGKTFKYTTTSPDKYPEFLFSRMLELVDSTSQSLNFKLDHFGLDFNDAFFYDANTYKKQSSFLIQGGGVPRRDYGRLFSAIDELKRKNIKIAYIINAFGKDPTEVELYSRTFRQEIKQVHKAFDYEVFQFWHKIPEKTLPENQPGTATNIFLNILTAK